MNIVWEDVRYLEAVGRTGSVGEAARELGVSASTVYRRVGALESAVGHPCLARGPGRRCSPRWARSSRRWVAARARRSPA